jgi:hypothetical protein
VAAGDELAGPAVPAPGELVRDDVGVLTGRFVVPEVHPLMSIPTAAATTTARGNTMKSYSRGTEGLDPPGRAYAWAWLRLDTDDPTSGWSYRPTAPRAPAITAS